MNVPRNRRTQLPKTLGSVAEATEDAKEISTVSSLPTIGVLQAPAKLSKKPNNFQTTASKHDIYYRVDQAGTGLFAIKDAPSLPSCTIKEYQKQKPSSAQRLTPVDHKNIIALVGFFESEASTYLVYQYEHIPISLGCIVGVVQFSESDIATVCREVLHGIQYIHSEIRISHGSINCSNILLTYTGDVKIANIGDSMLQEMTLRDRDKDIMAVGSLVIGLSDRSTLIGDELPRTIPESSDLSTPARCFIDNTRMKSVKELLKDDFIQIATPGGAWSLKPHYFEALPFGFHVGTRIPEKPYK